MLKINIYSDQNGDEPYTKWITSIKDSQTKARIQQRLRRLELGNLGDHRWVGESIWELKLDFGPGYRIYYAKQGNKIIILLCGGDKGSQEKDIKKAQKYWKEYMES